MSAWTETPARSTEELPAGPMLPRPFVVTRTRRDAVDTWTLWLEALDGQPSSFRAGQFNMLHAFGVGEVPISVSGEDPGDAVGALQHTVRDVGSVSHALSAATPGTTVGVRGPFGTGWEVGAGRGGDVLFVAGGIGLAPLRPAVREVCAARSEYGQVAVLYGARTPADILFAEDLATWAERHDVDVRVSVDNGQADWGGHVGPVTQLIGRVPFSAQRTLALLCGPEVMMRLGAHALVDSGVPASRVRLSMERNMKCGVGLCGHCQLRELLLCTDGPVLPYDVLGPLMARAEL